MPQKNNFSIDEKRSAMKPLPLLTFPTLLAVVLLLGACDKKRSAVY